MGRNRFGILQNMTTDEILAEIDSEIARLKQVRALLSTDGTKKTAATPSAPKKRKMSAAARKRIGDAQRKRWASKKGVVESAPVKGAKEVAPPVKKKGMSAEGKKRIAAAQKKRWAAINAAKEAEKKVPAKKVAKKVNAKKATAVKKAPAKKAAPRKAPATTAKKVAATDQSEARGI